MKHSDRHSFFEISRGAWQTVKGFKTYCWSGILIFTLSFLLIICLLCGIYMAAAIFARTSSFGVADILYGMLAGLAFMILAAPVTLKLLLPGIAAAGDKLSLEHSRQPGKKIGLAVLSLFRWRTFLQLIILNSLRWLPLIMLDRTQAIIVNSLSHGMLRQGMLGISILTSVLYLLLLIPRLTLAEFYILDRKVNSIQAYIASFRATRKHLGLSLSILLAPFGLTLLAFLTGTGLDFLAWDQQSQQLLWLTSSLVIIVCVIWIIPYALQLRLKLYDRLTQQ